MTPIKLKLPAEVELRARRLADGRVDFEYVERDPDAGALQRAKDIFGPMLARLGYDARVEDRPDGGVAIVGTVRRRDFGDMMVSEFLSWSRLTDMTIGELLCDMVVANASPPLAPAVAPPTAAELATAVDELPVGADAVGHPDVLRAHRAQVYLLLKAARSLSVGDRQGAEDTIRGVLDGLRRLPVALPPLPDLDVGASVGAPPRAPVAGWHVLDAVAHWLGSEALAVPDGAGSCAASHCDAALDAALLGSAAREYAGRYPRGAVCGRCAEAFSQHVAAVAP